MTIVIPRFSQSDHPLRFDLLPERLRVLSSLRRRRKNESLYLHFTRTHGLPPSCLQNLARHLGGLCLGDLYIANS